MTAALIALLGVVVAAGPTDAAGGSVDLDQWASLAGAWQNGDLNGNNARYPEGGAVPFRLAIEGLSPGLHEIHLDYDFTAGGHKAYDFLTSWNAWLAPNLCSPSGGAISSLCPSLPAPSSAAFPVDPFPTDGLPVSGAQAYSAAPRRLTIFGGSVASIGPVVHTGSVDGNSSADMLVRFRSTGSAVLLAWAGHLAQSTFWNLAAGGTRDGAGEVSGAPWHMRTLRLDGAGNKNQDRSIQPSAIVGEVPPFGLAPTPPPSSPTPVPTRTAPTPAASTVPQRPGATSPGGIPTLPATATTGDAAPGTPDVRWAFALLLMALVLLAITAPVRRRG